MEIRGGEENMSKALKSKSHLIGGDLDRQSRVFAHTHAARSQIFPGRGARRNAKRGGDLPGTGEARKERRVPNNPNFGERRRRSLRRAKFGPRQDSGGSPIPAPAGPTGVPSPASQTHRALERTGGGGAPTRAQLQEARRVLQAGPPLLPSRPWSRALPRRQRLHLAPFPGDDSSFSSLQPSGQVLFSPPRLARLPGDGPEIGPRTCSCGRRCATPGARAWKQVW